MVNPILAHCDSAGAAVYRQPSIDTTSSNQQRLHTIS